MLCISFPPLYQADARVLVLGTMPSVASLAQAEYYAHPRNAFWRIQFALWTQPFSADYAAKKALQAAHRVAMWDTVESCSRTGSLDANMREKRPNDIAGLVAKLPDLRHVFCNGQAAFQEYKRYFSGIPLPVTCLPSTSPAYTLAYEKKLAAWQAVRAAVLQEEAEGEKFDANAGFD